MKNQTQIFNSFAEFLNRLDKSINGVSADHAEKFPNWQEDNETNEGCWNCRYCSDCSSCSYCSDCSDCSYCSYCSYCSSCSSCRYCSDCRSCSDCSDCSDCSYCSYCSDCSDCSYCSDCRSCSDCSKPSENDKQEESEIEAAPDYVVKNLHQKVLQSVQTGRLKMDEWHADRSTNENGEYCGTTHCWAGWIVKLAGKPGKDLEDRLGTSVAALKINHASSPIHIGMVRFFESNDEAMARIEEYAQKEIELNNESNSN